MNDLVRPVIAGLEQSDMVVNLQLKGLPNELAIRRARRDSGSSISWIVGHLLSFRCMVLDGLGVDTGNPYEKLFAFDNPASEGSDYPDVAELFQGWRDLHPKLLDGLADLTSDQLNGPTTLPSLSPSLLGALTFLAWHETYHLGAVGMLRVQWGQRHTHELAMEAMADG